jgi:hypothetical protein
MHIISKFLSSQMVGKVLNAKILANKIYFQDCLWVVPLSLGCLDSGYADIKAYVAFGLQRALT